MIKTLYILMLLLASSPLSAAWDGSVTGKIGRIEVTDSGNYGFRVYLKGSPKLCGTQISWAYISSSNSNYDTYVSLITAAKFAGAEVRLFTTEKTNDFCQIGFLYVY